MALLGKNSRNASSLKRHFDRAGREIERIAIKPDDDVQLFPAFDRQRILRVVKMLRFLGSDENKFLWLRRENFAAKCTFKNRNSFAEEINLCATLDERDRGGEDGFVCQQAEASQVSTFAANLHQQSHRNAHSKSTTSLHSTTSYTQHSQVLRCLQTLHRLPTKSSRIPHFKPCKRRLHFPPWSASPSRTIVIHIKHHKCCNFSLVASS